MQTTEAAPIATAVAEYSPIVADLATLRHRFGNVSFDLTTKAGEKQAREARALCVAMRTTLESKRKEIKAPALERAKAIDSDAKLIEAAIREVEKPIHEQITVVEEARAAERQRALDEIAAKTAALRRRVAEVFGIPQREPGTPRRTAADLRAIEREIAARPVDDSFGDLKVEAYEAKAKTAEFLLAAIAAAEGYETEQADLAKQRAEVEAQRKRDAEDREREVEARKQRESEEAACRAKARQAEDEERAKRHALENAARAAEETRLAAARAEIERQEREVAAKVRAAAEAAEVAERERQKAERAARLRAEQEAEAARERIAEAQRRDAEVRDALADAAPAMLLLLRDWARAEHQDGTEVQRRMALGAVVRRRDAILDPLSDIELAPEESH